MLISQTKLGGELLPEHRRSVQLPLKLSDTLKSKTLKLELDRLVSSALSAHVSPIFVQPALGCTDRWRHHNVLRKPVPVCDYSVAE